MAQIKIDLAEPLLDGMDVKFKAPCDCSAVTGIVVYYPTEDESTASKTFSFRDAHGNNLTGLGNLFSEGSYVKVILNVTDGYAYIQNADTNAYLESRFAPTGYGLGGTAQMISYENLDSTKANGWYRFSFPEKFVVDTITVQHCLMEVVMYNTDTVIQRLHPLFTNGKMLVRFCSSGTWSAWMNFQKAINPAYMLFGTEYATPEYWHGAAVYTKMLSFAPSSFTSQTISLPHGITGLTRGLSIDVLWKYVNTNGSATWRQLPSVYYSNVEWNGQAYFEGTTNIKFELGATIRKNMAESTDNIYVTLRYTK